MISSELPLRIVVWLEAHGIAQKSNLQMLAKFGTEGSNSVDVAIDLLTNVFASLGCIGCDARFPSSAGGFGISRILIASVRRRIARIQSQIASCLDVSIFDPKVGTIQWTFSLKNSASPLQVGEEIIRSVDDVAIEWSAQPDSVVEQNDLFDGIDFAWRQCILAKLR